MNFLGIVPRQATLFGQESRPQPPMGLAYVANAVHAAGWKFDLLDACTAGNDLWVEDPITNCRVTGLPDDEVVCRTVAASPDVIGISLGVSTDHDLVASLARALKVALPRTPIVVGGSQASLMGRRLFEGLPIERIPVDYVVTGRDLGSGEATVAGLLRCLAKGETVYRVPGLMWIHDGEVRQTTPALVNEEILNNLQLPRRDLFAMKGGIDIYSSINRSHTGPADVVPYAVLHTSRGCGGACTFCHINYGGFDRRLMRRSLASVEYELDWLRVAGYKSVSIEDDNFGGFTPDQSEHALTILRAISERGFECLYFPNGLTLRSMLSKESAILRVLREMADGGMKIRNSIPIECGDDRTLAGIINKPHRVCHVEAVIEAVSRYLAGHPNVTLDAFFMAGIVGISSSGHPIPERCESIDATIALARRVAELGIRVNLWWMKPNPGGPQYDLWRQKYPEKPFFELQFLFPSGIWGTADEERRLDLRIREFNWEMNQAGCGSLRPIYPVHEPAGAGL